MVFIHLVRSYWKMQELTKFCVFSKYLYKLFHIEKFYIWELFSKACLLPFFNQATFLGIKNFI